MNNTSRICQAAVGRVLTRLIESAVAGGWTDKQLGATIAAVNAYIVNSLHEPDEDVVMDVYKKCCEQIDMSERRSLKARERWRRKRETKPTQSEEPIIISDKTPGIIEAPVVKSEVMSEAGSVLNIPRRIVPPYTGWSGTVELLAGKVKLPDKRPVYFEDVPDNLRAMGVESYVEFIRHKYYREGLRGADLDKQVARSADELAENRRRAINGF